MKDLCSFGKRIKEARVTLNMTQEELAKKVGYVSRSSINKIELGLADIPQTKIYAIAQALGVSPTYLLTGENDKQSKKQKEMSENDMRVALFGDITDEMWQEIKEYADYIIHKSKNR